MQLQESWPPAWKTESCWFLSHTSSCYDSGLQEDFLWWIKNKKASVDRFCSIILIWKSRIFAKYKKSITSLCANIFQFEGLWCLKGKDGITLLNDVKIVVIITKWTMKTIIVHFSQNKLKEEKKTVNLKDMYQLRLSVFILLFQNKHSHLNIIPYTTLVVIYIYSHGIFTLPFFINVSTQLLQP